MPCLRHTLSHSMASDHDLPHPAPPPSLPRCRSQRSCAALSCCAMTRLSTSHSLLTDTASSATSVRYDTLPHHTTTRQHVGRSAAAFCWSTHPTRAPAGAGHHDGVEHVVPASGVWKRLAHRVLSAIRVSTVVDPTHLSLRALTRCSAALLLLASLLLPSLSLARASTRNSTCLIVRGFGPASHTAAGSMGVVVSWCMPAGRERLAARHQQLDHTGQQRPAKPPHQATSREPWPPRHHPPGTDEAGRTGPLSCCPPHHGPTNQPHGHPPGPARQVSLCHSTNRTPSPGAPPPGCPALQCPLLTTHTALTCSSTSVMTACSLSLCALSRSAAAATSLPPTTQTETREAAHRVRR